MAKKFNAHDKLNSLKKIDDGKYPDLNKEAIIITNQEKLFQSKALKIYDQRNNKKNVVP